MYSSDDFLAGPIQSRCMRHSASCSPVQRQNGSCLGPVHLRNGIRPRNAGVVIVRTRPQIVQVTVIFVQIVAKAKGKMGYPNL